MGTCENELVISVQRQWFPITAFIKRLIITYRVLNVSDEKSLLDITFANVVHFSTFQFFNYVPEIKYSSLLTQSGRIDSHLYQKLCDKNCCYFSKCVVF